jgi:hypothetical protein
LTDSDKSGGAWGIGTPLMEAIMKLKYFILFMLSLGISFRAIAYCPEPSQTKKSKGVLIIEGNVASKQIYAADDDPSLVGGWIYSIRILNVGTCQTCVLGKKIKAYSPNDSGRVELLKGHSYKLTLSMPFTSDLLELKQDGIGDIKYRLSICEENHEIGAGVSGHN